MKINIGVRNSDCALMSIPSYYTKRRLYEILCFINGWEIKCASDGSYPPVIEFKKEWMIKNPFVMKECHYD